MVGCHHQLNGHEFEQALGDVEGQEILAWCNSWGVRHDWGGVKILDSKDLLPMQEMQETHVHSLGWEDPLEESMATHSSILAWGIPWTEELRRLQSMGLPRLKRLRRQDVCLGVFSPTVTLLSPLLSHTSLWNTFLYPTLYFGSTICCLFPEGKMVLLPAALYLSWNQATQMNGKKKKNPSTGGKRWAQYIREKVEPRFRYHQFPSSLVVQWPRLPKQGAGFHPWSGN